MRSSSSRHSAIRARRLVSLALGVAIGAGGATFAAVVPSAVIGASPVTVAVVGRQVWSYPDDQRVYNGTVAGLGTSWQSPDLQWTTIYMSPPTGGGLTAGTSFSTINGGPDATHGTLQVANSGCFGDRVDVLGATYNGGGDVTSFAADFVTCGRTGAIRLASTSPIAVLRTGLNGSGVTRYNFGLKSTGTTTAATITFKNVGTETLSVGPATIIDDGYGGSTPEDFSVGSSTCTSTVAVGASCTVQARYSPLWDGVRRARLELASSPASAGIDVDLFAQATFADATNDRIGNAVEVGALPFTLVENVQATTGDRLDPICHGAYLRSVWFHLVAPASQPITIDTAGSMFQDTALSVYTGSPDALQQLVCNDDVSPSDKSSLVRFPALAATEYWIEVAKGQAAGFYALRLNVSVGGPDSTVSVAGFGQEATTFYPYPDGYADTVGTSATPGEPVDVTVDIAPSASPATIARHASVGRRDGIYSFVWNGRNDAGALVPPGSYQVVHHYVDLFGNTSQHAFTVIVSAKRLYYKTTAATLVGARSYDEGWSQGGSVRYSGSTLILKAGKGWAAAVYRTKLVAAVVYKSVQFEVTGKSSNSRKVQIGIFNYALGDYDAWRWIGPRKAAWKTATVGAAEHAVGRMMYGMVMAPRQSSGSVTFTIYRVRLIYTYGVLQ